MKLFQRFPSFLILHLMWTQMRTSEKEKVFCFDFFLKHLQLLLGLQMTEEVIHETTCIETPKNTEEKLGITVLGPHPKSIKVPVDFSLISMIFFYFKGKSSFYSSLLLWLLQELEMLTPVFSPSEVSLAVSINVNTCHHELSACTEPWTSGTKNNLPNEQKGCLSEIVN